MAITNRLRILAVLTDGGYKLGESSSSRYERLDGFTQTLWVGKSGAIRSGTSASSSFSITTNVMKRVDAEWEKWDEEKQATEIKRVKQLLKGRD